MYRAALFALLVVSVLNGTLRAQRSGATFHGNAAGQSARSGLVGLSGFPNRFLPGGRSLQSGSHRHDRFASVFAPYFVPYDDSFGYEPDAEAVVKEPVPPVVTQRTSEPPVPKAQVIEIPGTGSSTAVKTLPPTVFILANGERLEARRFVLTASNLSVSIARQQRTVPLDMLDINATISTNHARGIDLRIPDGPSEISISF